jgi:hypothetical protein
MRLSLPNICVRLSVIARHEAIRKNGLLRRCAPRNDEARSNQPSASISFYFLPNSRFVFARS